ncbi:hypothetical protein [Nonomuraea sp. NPDC049695]|uniref:hypothetical protein n=1 Tax=Nonomuraea sp. NPDC049695 TaxID=3154734 RepID=UPI00342AB654
MPGSARICGTCDSELSRELRSIPDLFEDLNLAISRQSRMGAGAVGASNPSMIWTHYLCASTPAG